MPDPNLKFLPIDKELLKDNDHTNIDNWTKHLFPHPAPFWEFWNLEEDFKYDFVSLATIWDEERLIKPELLMAKEGVNQEDAMTHLERVSFPNIWFFDDAIGIRVTSYLIYLWFTKESVHSELQRLLGNNHG